ncbi:MAG: DUF433 domain-containing protein [Verrucomicrobiota bacterium]
MSLVVAQVCNLRALCKLETQLLARCKRDSFPHMQTVVTAHIHLDERGVAWIDDTNIKVIEVAQDMLAHGWSPEEIHFQHAHLSLAQIHAGLGYYYDHKTEMDEVIRRSLRNVEKLRTETGDSPIRKRLRELGKLP